MIGKIERSQDLSAETIEDAARLTSRERQLEIELSKRNEFNKVAIENAPIGLITFTEDDSILECNDSILSMFGVTEEYFRKYFPSLSPEYQGDGTKSFDKWKGIRTKLSCGERVVFEWTHQRPEGTLIPCEVTVVRIKQGTGYIDLSYVYDLSNIKKMAYELKKQDNLLQAMNRAANTLLAAEGSENFESSIRIGLEIMGGCVEADCVEIWKNEEKDGEAFVVLKHYWRNELAGKIKPGITEIPYSKTPDLHNRLSRGEIITGSMDSLSDKDREFMHIFKVQTTLIFPIIFENHYWGLCCVDNVHESRSYSKDEIDIIHSGILMVINAINRHDLSQRKMLEEKYKTISEAKSRFLANMSHEIRTPMNSIIGFAEMAQSDDIPVKTKGYLNRIQESSELLLSIINDILDISKIESGKMELERVPFDLHEIFEYCRSVILPKAEEKGLIFYCYTEPSAGKKLVGDPVRLRQALLNLLSNAVKFTNKGTIKLLASIINYDDTSAVIQFEVKDTGIGMSADQIAKVFDPFVQADSSITRKYGGTGLGLAITKNIIELMGGDLKTESAPGIGSKFSFNLEFELFEDDHIENDSLQATRAADNGGTSIRKTPFNESEKLRFEGEILVCEDNDMNQQVICEHLARVGLKTTVAGNGQEGIEIVNHRIKNGEKPFDLIFMDIHMPVMDGLEAAKRLADDGCKTPIIALTANIMTSDTETYFAMGMSDYLQKPLTTNNLWSCLLKYLTPVKMIRLKDDDDKESPENINSSQLKSIFAESNRNVFKEICAAIDAQDIKLAHRLAHTLKSTSALVGMKKLQEAAKSVEYSLASGKMEATTEQIVTLGNELENALKELEPFAEIQKTPSPSQPFDREKALAFLEKLDLLLEKNNVDCIDLTDELNSIEGTALLIEQIQNLDFAIARKTLAAIKNQL